MGSIYKPKDKKYWYISFIDPDTGKPKNRSTGLLATHKNRRKAEQILLEVEDVINEKKDLYKNSNIQRATIGEAFERFLKMNSDKNIKTIGDYERFIKLFSETFDLNSPCTAIDKISAKDWIIDIKKIDKQKNTIYNYFKVFNKFINFLFEDDYIAPPFKINSQIKPKPETKKIIVFSKVDIKKIIEALENKNTNFKTIVIALIYTGLRPSDIIELTVEQINIKEKVIDYYSPKTKEYLSVPIHEKLAEVLMERIIELKSGKIFNYATIGEIGKAFRRFLKANGLNKKGYNLRTFRKNFATIAYENDISLMTTAKLLGHKNISTTMKYYTATEKKKLATDLNKMKFTLGE